MNNIVLTAGCFDIIHPGHIRFLYQAKKLGRYLIVLLESDQKVKKLKGKNRPIFSQKQRKLMLQNLRSVDKVISLQGLTKDEDYLKILQNIKPKIIAVTEKTPHLQKIKTQAGSINADLKILPFDQNYSTTKILNQLL